MPSASLKSTSNAVKTRGNGYQARARAIAGLRTLLSGSKLGPADFIPSEPMLAQQLKVARSTVRLALKALEDEGLLKTVEGKGRLLSPTARQGYSLMTHTIGVLTYMESRAESVSRRSLGWSSSIQDGILEGIKEAGQHALVLHPDRIQRAHVEALRHDRPRGIVAFPPVLNWKIGREVIEAFKEVGVPVVMLDGVEGMSCDVVASDHAKGCAELVRWLASRGKKRILRVWNWPAENEDVRPSWLGMRDKGYDLAVREKRLQRLDSIEFRGLPLDAGNKAEFDQKVRTIAAALPEYLTGAKPVDAILVSSDSMVCAVAAACRLFHKTPGVDVEIAGYDNTWFDCLERKWESTIPGATVDKKNPEVGKALIEMLNDRIDGRLASSQSGSGFKTRRLFPSVLIGPGKAS